MIDKKKYTFRKHSNSYKKLFNKEKSRLRKVIPDATIEHVGSTAVQGLGGKGIIDIAIRIPGNKAEQFIRKLKKLGYESSKEHAKNSERIFIKRTIKYAGEKRQVHVHLVLNKEFWNSFILIRDYLRENTTESERYAKIKKEAIKYANGDGRRYREYKNDFLKSLLRKAKKRYFS